MTHYYEGFPQSDRDEKIKMVNVDELEERVKKVMPEGAYYYIASGAENEWTWRNNTAAFNHFQIVPRALTEMADSQTDTDFMGMHLKTPIKKAGYQGIFLTVDALVSGYREANLRTNFTYPVPLDFFKRYLGAKGKGQSVAQMYASSAQKIGPEDVKRIKKESGLPVFVKGVMCAEDAYKAIGAGADGIYVTNHGGREVDGAPATIDVLPEIAQAVNHRVPIIFDSGVRRGSHIFKALALGADIVGIGRPYLYGLALGGAHGVASVIEQLNDELKIDMQLTGCKTIDDVKHAKLTHIAYTADNLPSNTDPSRRKEYPVTDENQVKQTDAVSGASKLEGKPAPELEADTTTGASVR